MRRAAVLPVYSAWRASMRRTSGTLLACSGLRSTICMLQWMGNAPSGSYTNAMPPLMPAAKLRPVGPRMSARPPVMYSHPWSPTPSTTAQAPEFRTQKRSPATPRK